MTDGGLIDERLRCRGCGQVHPQARIVSLPDGRQVGNYSEEHRRYWEANWVLKRYRSKRTRQAYLDEIERIRGFEAKMELREEMLKIWNWKKGQK